MMVSVLCDANALNLLCLQPSEQESVPGTGSRHSSLCSQSVTMWSALVCPVSFTLVIHVTDGHGVQPC